MENDDKYKLYEIKHNPIEDCKNIFLFEIKIQFLLRISILLYEEYLQSNKIIDLQEYSKIKNSMRHIQNEMEFFRMHIQFILSNITEYYRLYDLLSQKNIESVLFNLTNIDDIELQEINNIMQSDLFINSLYNLKSQLIKFNSNEFINNMFFDQIIDDVKKELNMIKNSCCSFYQRIIFILIEKEVKKLYDMYDI